MVDETSSAIQKLTAQLAADNDQAKQDRALELQTNREMLEKLKQDLDQKGIVAEDNEKFRAAQVAQQKAEFDFRKSNATSKAARAEIKKEEQEAFGGYFERFLGKDSSFAKGLSGIGQSLKQKVQGGLAGIFTALKAGAFLLFLKGMVTFLQSPTFKELQEKYLPVIADGLQSLYDTLKSIASGFFDEKTGEFSAAAGLSNIMSMISTAFTNWAISLKAGFFDEEGNFTLTGGIKNLAGDFATILASLTAFGLLLAPRLFFGTLWQIGKGGGGLAIRALGKIARGFGLLFTNIGGFNTSLADTGTTMDSKVKASKKTGVFRKGLGGITGRFGRLFRFFGRRGLIGLMIGAGVGMATMLADTKVFSSIGENFGKLFTKAGEFGSKVAKSATNMATRLGTAVSTGVFSIASGIGAKFNSLFSVLSDFGSSIAKVASKAAAKAASVVAKSLDDVAKIGAKVVESVVPTKKLNKKQLDALRGTGEFALKPTVGRDPKTGRFTKLTDTQRAALSGTGEFALPNKSAAKIGTELSEAALKKSFMKTGLGVAGKAIPLVGAAVGLGLSAWRALKGDFVGAGGEFAGIFAPSLVGLPLDLGLAARDIYYDQFGIYPEQEKDLKLAKSRMNQITSFLKKQNPPPAEVKPSGTAKPINLSNIKTYGDYLRVKDKMSINPAYDMDGDGVYNRLEFTNAMQGQRNLNTPMTAGPAFISAPTVNNNQNNIQSSPIVPLDPLMREAISAM